MKNIFIVLIIFLCFVLSVQADQGLRPGFAEASGCGEVYALSKDTGLALLSVPSLMIWNENKINVSLGENMIYQQIENDSLNNISFSGGYKLKNLAFGAIGNFFMSSHYNNYKFGVGAAYKIGKYFSAGGGYFFNGSSSAFEDYSRIGHDFSLSGSFVYSGLTVTAGCRIQDLASSAPVKDWHLDTSYQIKSWIIGLDNRMSGGTFLPRIGTEYKLNSNMFLRAGVSFQDCNLGLGIILVKSLMMNYALTMHKELGIGNFIDLKFFIE